MSIANLGLGQSEADRVDWRVEEWMAEWMQARKGTLRPLFVAGSAYSQKGRGWTESEASLREKKRQTEMKGGKSTVGREK